MTTAAVDVMDVLVERWYGDADFRRAFCENPTATLARAGLRLRPDEREAVFLLGLPHLSDGELEQLIGGGIAGDGPVVRPGAHC
jgi:hypothetical protein